MPVLSASQHKLLKPECSLGLLNYLRNNSREVKNFCGQVRKVTDYEDEGGFNNSIVHGIFREEGAEVSKNNSYEKTAKCYDKE